MRVRTKEKNDKRKLYRPIIKIFTEERDESETRRRLEDGVVEEAVLTIASPTLITPHDIADKNKRIT